MSRYLLKIWFVLLLILVVLIFVIDLPQNLSFLKDYSTQIGLVLLIPLVGIAIFLDYKLSNMLWSVLLILLSFRLFFDAFVLPYRIQNEPYNFYKEDVIRVAKKYKDRPLYKIGFTPLDHSTIHYLTKEQDRIIYQTNSYPLQEKS